MRALSSKKMACSDTSGAQIHTPLLPTRMARLSARRKRVTVRSPQLSGNGIEDGNMHLSALGVKDFFLES